jgi:hypothetical protein
MSETETEVKTPTQAERLQEIADAIKIRTMTKYVELNENASNPSKNRKIKATTFADEILFMEVFTPITLYPNGLDNGYCGNLVAQTAATYYHAKQTRLDNFQYQQNSANILNLNYDNDDSFKDFSAGVRNDSGRGLIDCSSYVGLVLRGIPYNKSPFGLEKYKGNNTRWLPSAPAGQGGLIDMYGNTGWEYDILDKQPDKQWRNFGFEGYSTIRGAGELGYFFYNYGQVIYDKKIHGNLFEETIVPVTEENEDGIEYGAQTPLFAEIQSKLKPGDLIFFSKPGKKYNLSGKRHFSISHVAIAAENAGTYFEVTGADGVVGETIQYVSFNNRKNISLICRPNYLLFNPALAAPPLNHNIVCFPYYSIARDKTTFTTNGVTFSLTDNFNGIKISGTNTSAKDMEFILKGPKNDKLNRIILTKGKYKLTGLENSGISGDGLKLCLELYSDINANTLSVSAGNLEHYNAENHTSPEIDVKNDKVGARILLKIKSGTQLNCTISPKLERID